MSAEHIDFLADYALLGIDPGSGLDAVRQAYRRAVQRVHPDRGKADDADDADGAAMVAINLAYGRLCAFHREYGRLPLEPLATGGGVPRPRVAVPPVARRARVGVLATVFLLAGGGVAWLLAAGSAGHDPLGAPGLPMPRMETPAAPLFAPAGPIGDDADGIRLGDTPARVRRVLGRPILAERDLWEYGPSHVRFERGRVVGWYSSPMKPLKIAQPDREDTGAR